MWGGLGEGEVREGAVGLNSGCGGERRGWLRGGGDGRGDGRGDGVGVG